MKKVLIITYYWPPSGGVGAQRWLKFAKYLRANNWEPVIFTPENPDFDIKDESSVEEISADMEVLKLPIWEPYQLFKNIKGKKVDIKQGLVLESKKKTWVDKFSIWLRGNVLIPDPRVFWVRPASKFIHEIIESNNIDVVVTTGPPHSIHLIGLNLITKHNVKWIADFRDPWSKWDLLDKLGTTKWAKNIHHRLERKVLQKATVVLTVSKSLALSLKELGASNVKYITNGYDEDDGVLEPIKKSEKFVLSHIGLLNEMRNPDALWEALVELCETNDEFAKDLEIRLGGIVSESIRAQIINTECLKSATTFIDYIPHNEVYKEYAKASVLLLILNNTNNSKWILPSKLYEYIYSGQPILMLGEIKSDAAEIVASFEHNCVVDFNEKEGLKAGILAFYQQYKNNQTIRSVNNVSKYSRKNLTVELAEIMNDIIKIIE